MGHDAASDVISYKEAACTVIIYVFYCLTVIEMHGEVGSRMAYNMTHPLAVWEGGGFLVK